MVRPRLLLLFALSAVVAAIPTLSCGGSGAESSVSQELSTAGGTVSLADEVTVHFPPGALPETTTVTITRASDESEAPEGPEAADPVGDAFTIDIGERELNGPVTIEFAYDASTLPDDTPETAIFLAFFDDESDEWIPVFGEIDTERGVIAIQTEHLSWWNPWTWNWGAWIAVLTNTLTLNVTDFLEAVAVLTDDCPQSGETTTVDASDANNVVQGCVEKDDPSQPELRVVNPKSFFFEVSSVSHGYFEQTLLGPGKSLRFEASTSDEPPMVVAAEITQEAGWRLVLHLVL